MLAEQVDVYLYFESDCQASPSTIRLKTVSTKKYVFLYARIPVFLLIG